MQGPAGRRRRSSCRWAWARTSRTGACPRRASSSSTGGSGRGVGDAGDRLHARAPRVGAHCCSTRTRSCGPATRFVGPRHRAFFSGDTGLFPAHARHRRAPGPVRRHDDRGRPVPPRLARLAHRPRAGGARARHGARAGDVADALGAVHARLRTAGPSRSSARWRPARRAGRDDRDPPRPGESVEPEAPPRGRALVAASVPWRPRAETPIVSTQVD